MFNYYKMFIELFYSYEKKENKKTEIKVCEQCPYAQLCYGTCVASEDIKDSIKLNILSPV